MRQSQQLRKAIRSIIDARLNLPGRTVLDPVSGEQVRTLLLSEALASRPVDPTGYLLTVDINPASPSFGLPVDLPDYDAGDSGLPRQ